MTFLKRPATTRVEQRILVFRRQGSNFFKARMKSCGVMTPLVRLHMNWLTKSWMPGCSDAVAPCPNADNIPPCVQVQEAPYGVTTTCLYILPRSISWESELNWGKFQFQGIHSRQCTLNEMICSLSPLDSPRSMSKTNEMQTTLHNYTTDAKNISQSSNVSSNQYFNRVIYVSCVCLCEFTSRRKKQLFAQSLWQHFAI